MSVQFTHFQFISPIGARAYVQLHNLCSFGLMMFKITQNAGHHILKITTLRCINIISTLKRNNICYDKPLTVEYRGMNLATQSMHRHCCLERNDVIPGPSQLCLDECELVVDIGVLQVWQRWVETGNESWIDLSWL